MRIILFSLVLVFTINSCTQKQNFYNEQTSNYIEKLKNQAKSGKIMLGLANGLDKSYKDPFGKNKKIDCLEITGKLPAFVENDFLFISDNQQFKDNELKLMKHYYNQGVTFGFCWHIKGMNSNSFYNNDKDSLLAKRIANLENSIERKWFYKQIDSLIVPVFKELEFPIFFRPFHEMNGKWFWWGCENINPQEYIKLYRILVDRIRENGCKNVIFSFSPDTYLKEEYYPGDDYVDLIGLDVYEPNCSPYHKDGTFTEELSKLIEFANKHNKLAAITEVGLREYNGTCRYPMEIPDFWSQKVVKPLIDENGNGKNILYFMSWYNSDWQMDDKGSLYYPYNGMETRFGEQGKKAIDDFKSLANNKNILFVEN